MTVLVTGGAGFIGSNFVKYMLNKYEDYTIVNLDKLSQAEQETRLLELALSGNQIGAIAMARKLYGYDLSRAKEFVEGLARKKR